VGVVTDPRAALAEVMWPTPPENMALVERMLAERGVLLVTAPMLRTAVNKVAAVDAAHDWHPRDEQADDIFDALAALSAEAEELERSPYAEPYKSELLP
jgi:hypothetical protein